MRPLTTLTLFSLLASLVAAGGRPVPAGLKAFRDGIVGQGGCKNVLKDERAGGDDGSEKTYYCADHLDDKGVVYLTGDGNKLADMDTDCDGAGATGGGQCGNDPSNQAQTAFKDTIQSYGKGVDDIAAQHVPYVVLGNKDFNLEDHGIKPLSVVAVVCGDKLVYGVWADTNGENSTGEASISLASMCFDGMTGNNGHTEMDVLYLAFKGDEAVPGNSAPWDTQDPNAFEDAIAGLGDKLVSRFGGDAPKPEQPKVEPAKVDKPKDDKPKDDKPKDDKPKEQPNNNNNNNKNNNKTNPNPNPNTNAQLPKQRTDPVKPTAVVQPPSVNPNPVPVVSNPVPIVSNPAPIVSNPAPVPNTQTPPATNQPLVNNYPPQANTYPPQADTYPQQVNTYTPPANTYPQQVNNYPPQVDSTGVKSGPLPGLAGFQYANQYATQPPTQPAVQATGDGEQCEPEVVGAQASPMPMLNGAPQQAPAGTGTGTGTLPIIHTPPIISTPPVINNASPPTVATPPTGTGSNTPPSIINSPPPSTIPAEGDEQCDPEDTGPPATVPPVNQLNPAGTGTGTGATGLTGLTDAMGTTGTTGTGSTGATGGVTTGGVTTASTSPLASPPTGMSLTGTQSTGGGGGSKEDKKAQREAEKAQRKAQREQEKQQRKAQREQEKQQRKAQREKEKAERKAQREQEKAARKAQKEAEKAAKKGGGGGGEKRRSFQEDRVAHRARMLFAARTGGA